MTAPYHRGDIVVIKPKVAKAYTTTKKLNWLGRTGEVRYCNDHVVTLIWKGCHTLDQINVKGVQLLKRDAT